VAFIRYDETHDHTPLRRGLLRRFGLCRPYTGWIIITLAGIMAASLLAIIRLCSTAT